MHSANHIYPEGMFCRTLSPIRPLEPCPQNPYPRRPYSLGSGPPAMFTGYVALLLDSRQPMSHTLNSDDLWTTCYNIQKLLSQGERINEFGGLSLDPTGCPKVSVTTFTEDYSVIYQVIAKSFEKPIVHTTGIFFDIWHTTVRPKSPWFMLETVLNGIFYTTVSGCSCRMWSIPR